MRDLINLENCQMKIQYGGLRRGNHDKKQVLFVISSHLDHADLIGDHFQGIHGEKLKKGSQDQRPPLPLKKGLYTCILSFL